MHQQRADPTVGAEHHHGVSTADHRGLQQAPGRHAVDDHRIGLFGAQAGGHRDKTGGVGDQPVGPPAGLGQRGHPLSDDRAPSPGERPLVVVLAAAHPLLGERDSGRLHPYQRLPGRDPRDLPGP
ncbi:hypothetical protein ACFV8Z_51290 [Streptomyces sp. NPDC059837]|uniref:hypothetical protein n=1 Tax=unclassified Streptomyces TaxID=2593676 RepID=UPI00364E7BFE